MHERYGLREVNVKGKSIVEFSSTFDLIITNTCFRKSAELLIIYKCKMIYYQINFFLFRKADKKICLNYKVIPGENLTI